MNLHNPADNKFLSRRIRWLAIFTACFTAVIASLSIGVLFLVIPGCLLIGAILEPRFSQLGKGLMAMGALFLSAIALPLGVAMFIDVGRLSFHDDFNKTGISLLWMLSFVLVVWCDAALVLEAVRIRSAKRRSTWQSA